MTTPGFVHLHVHTEHSPLDGLASPDDAVNKVAADGQSALAITDHGTLSGAWKFANAARRAGVKPIIGIEGYLAVADDWQQEPDRFAPGSIEVDRDDAGSDLDDDDKGVKVKHYNHITLLAATAQGYENLVAMGNKSNATFRRHPLMDFALMSEYGEGIIALTGCIGGPVMGPVSRGNIDEARANLRRLIDAFGKSNVYVEVMEHGIAAESAALPALAELAAEFDLPLVATNDAHYVRAEDGPIHEGLLAMQSGKPLSDPTRFHFHGDGFHLRTEAEMRVLRDEPWWQDACSNTVLVAERCEDVVPKPEMRLPKFPLPDGWDDSRKYLVHLVKEGAKERYGDPLPAEVTTRLNFEMKVIADAGFVDYFLIVHDIVAQARAAGIRVGPGRGSAAGCAISYCLKIVMVDPLENNLLFERFLEPGRAGMPDIDVDFEKGRRGEVLDMLVAKYGASRVARIGSFAASKSRRVLRDAAKVLEVSGVGDTLARAVPIGDGGQPFTFKRLLDPAEQASDLFRTRLAAAGEDGERVLELARGIEGTLIGQSIHACGTLISDADLTALIPLRKDRSKASIAALDSVTQWDGKDIDDYGLLKLDVLGLRNLDIVSLAAKMIEATTGEVIDPDDLPHPNTKGHPRVQATWELLRSGRTAGVFQMESQGMASLAQDIRPDCLGDLSAVVALFRPGPLSAGMHQMYADRKNGLQQVDYSIFTHDKGEQEAIAEVLGETYGVFVYQEQLMRLGTVVAGFDVNMRSKLRKAVGKKIPALMAEVGESFVAGAEQEFHDPETGELISRRFAKSTAENLFEYMKGSADYLFNASHSFAYAQLAYVTAYLKANWPSAYGAAILASTDKDDKRLAALRALREEGIEVLAPDVNRSLGQTSPLDDKTVLLGLTEIKDVGSVGELIVKARDDREEPFADLHDLLKRVVDVEGRPALNVGAAEALIEAGALDVFGPRKGLVSVVRAAKAAALPVPNVEWGVLERSTRQRMKLGAIMGPHPMTVLDDQVRAWRTPTTVIEGKSMLGRPAHPLSSIPEKAGENVTVAAVLAEWAERGYKGGRMANFTLEAPDVSIRGVAWDRTVSALHAGGLIPTIGSIVAVSGRVDLKQWDSENDEGETELHTTKEVMAQQVWTLDIDDKVAPVDTDRGETAPTPLRAFGLVEKTTDAAHASEPAEAHDDVVVDFDVPPEYLDGAYEEPVEMPTPEEPELFVQPAVTALPVLFVNSRRNVRFVKSNTGSGSPIIEMVARARSGVSIEPNLPKLSKTPGVHAVLLDGAQIAWLAVTPADFAAFETIPSTWPVAAGEPTLADLGVLAGETAAPPAPTTEHVPDVPAPPAPPAEPSVAAATVQAEPTLEPHELAAVLAATSPTTTPAPTSPTPVDFDLLFGIDEEMFA